MLTPILSSISLVVRGTEQKFTMSLCLLDNDTFGVSECLSRVSKLVLECLSRVSWSVSECLSRVSESSVRVLDLVTFPLDLVTFFSPNRDDKFLCLVIIHKRDIDIFVKCTSDAATYTSVWQQVYGIVKKEHIARHRGSCLYVIISASSALSNTLRLSAPFFTHTIPLLS